MSVEKIAALSNLTVDALNSRGSGSPGPHAAGAPAAPIFVAPAGDEASAIFFDSISLPLPDAGAPPGNSALGASYAREATNFDLPQLLAGQLPSQIITRKIATMLRNAANERDTTVARVIDEAAVLKDDRLPSHNDADAGFTLRTSFPAQEENGEVRTFDLYLTRVGARQWEAAVFRREAEDAAAEFPYAAPPINIERLVIDPSNGQILACVAQQLVAREFAPQIEAQALALVGAMRASMFAVAIVGITVILAKTLSTFIAIGFFVTAVALVIRIPNGRREKEKSVRRSRRRRP